MINWRTKTTFFIVLMLGLVIWHTVSADEGLYFDGITAGDGGVLEDGRVVHLLGVKAPAPDQYALSQQSTAALQKLTDDAEITLGNVAIDRYGRLSAHVYAEITNGKKVWLQQDMLRQGLVFVYPPTGKEARLDAMLEAENEARHTHRGLWADADYADTPADQAQDHYGHFAFVTGKVVKTERVKNMVYLEFGADWHSSFTVAIAAHDLKSFRQADIEPLAYQDKTVRVRGWVKRDYGPRMDIVTPAQIEILGPH